MDEVERQRFLDTLRNDEAFRAAVRRELDLEPLRELPEQVAHLTNGVNGLIAHQAELQQSVMTLAANQQRLGTELTGLLQEHLRMTAEGFALIGVRLTGVDTKLDSIDTKLDSIDTKLDSIDTRFDSIDARFDSIDTRFDSIDTKFDSIDTRFDSIDARFDSLEARVDDGFAAISAHFDQLDAAIAELRNERDS